MLLDNQSSQAQFHELLSGYREMHEQGELTDEEFQKIKSRMIRENALFGQNVTASAASIVRPPAEVAAPIERPDPTPANSETVALPTGPAPTPAEPTCESTSENLYLSRPGMGHFAIRMPANENVSFLPARSITPESSASASDEAERETEPSQNPASTAAQEFGNMERV